MPAKSFDKVRKSIAKKRGSKPVALHENSRDVKRLKRAGNREDKILARKASYGKAIESHVQRVAYFQDIVQSSDVRSYEAEDMLALVQAFIGRNDEKIEEAKASRRPGRPPSRDETELAQLKASEDRELSTGFWLPALQDAENVEALKKWHGEWVALGQLKFARVTTDLVLRDGAWPPNR